MRAALATRAADPAAEFASYLDRSLDRSFRLAAVILGNREDAEDAVEDAALRAWQHFASLRDHDRFDAWFGRIVVNVCRDRLRQRRGRPAALVFDPPSQLDAIDESVERAALHGALARLTPEHRAVVALHYLEGLTVDQIADRLGVRAGTVKSRIHYGVRELRAAYEAAQRDPGRTDR
jgi:RNA polymerase sigma-70 factor (ECF subfamily)